MEELWRTAVANFERRAGKPLRLSPAKTMEDCVLDIERMNSAETLPGPANTSQVATAKNLGIQSLKCIKLLGGVVAEGASTVFPPSKLCFNALCLLIDIPGKLHAFHKAIEGLFEVIGPSLNMFKIYDTLEHFGNVEEPLKQAIQKVMISFVNICGLSIQLRDSGRWYNFKLGVKHVLFDDDSGVRNEIRAFQELTKAHGDIQGTQTLKTVLESNEKLTELLNKAEETGSWQGTMDGKVDKLNATADNIHIKVSSLKDSDDKRKDENTHKKDLENIKKKLDLKESSIEASRDTCDKLHNSAVQDTAKWLRSDKQFQEWADRDIHTQRLFLLSGEKNTGKSVAMATISRHLQWNNDKSSAKRSRTLIADYFFPSLMGKDDDDKHPVQTALKCIAFQLAKQSDTYAKALSRDCNKMPAADHFKNSTCEDLWSSLGIETPKEDFVHYILIDGLSGLSNVFKEQQRQLCDLLSDLKPKQSNMRVLVSLRPDQRLRGEFHQMHVNEHNSLDIQNHINSEMQKKQMFQDTDETSLRMRNEMQRIVVNSNGSYSKVNAILDQVNTIVLSDGLESEIQRILDESSMDEKSLSESIIPELEATLTTAEVKELNELLVWVMYSKDWLNVEQLTAALYIRFKKRSLLGLERKLKGKYSRILVVHRDGRVRLNDNILKEWLIKEREEGEGLNKPPKFTAEISVSNADRTSIQSFLWSFSQKLNYDDFGFQVIEQSKAKIQVNEIDSHLSIVRSTFDFLKAESENDTRSLGLYMLAWLPDHLKHLVEARNNDALTRQDKKDITDGVLSLLCAERSITQHWDACGEIEWFRKPDELVIFRQWLDDGAATNHLGTADRDFLRVVTGSRHPDKALLSIVMRAVARKWVRDSQWEPCKPYEWISGYLALPRPGMTSDYYDLTFMTTVPFTDDFPRPRIQEVEDWCAESLHLQFETKDALWYRRVGQTCYAEREYSYGIESFENSLQMSSQNPDSLEGLARCLDQEEKYADACENMMAAIDILGKQEQPDLAGLSAKCVELAEWYNRKLRQPDKALASLKEAISKMRQEPRLHASLLKLYLTNSRHEDATKLLHQFFDEGKQDYAAIIDQILVCILMDYESPELFAACLFLLHGQAEAQKSVVQALRTASDKAKEADDTDEHMTLLLFEGIAMYHFVDGKEILHEKALALWNKCLKLSHHEDWSWSRATAFDLLCVHHFNHARILDESQHRQGHLESLRGLLDQDKSTAPITAAASSLASYYAVDDRSQALDILRSSVDHASTILSDENDENDWEGFLTLAAALLHSGDESNALIAFHFLLPGTNAGNLLSWLLDFESEPAKSVAADLVSLTLRTCQEDAHLHEQLRFALHIVYDRLRPASVSPSDMVGFHIEDTHGQSYEFPFTRQMDEDMTADPITESEDPATLADLSEIPAEMTAERLDLDKKLEPEEVPDTDSVEAYREIQEKLEQWLQCKNYLPFQYVCDGCEKIWNFENAMHICKYCLYRAYCDDCLADLREDKLASHSFSGLLCSRDHEWLRLPKWEKEEFITAFQRNIVLPGYSESGETTVVSVAEWFSSIKKEWGIKEDKIDRREEPLDADLSPPYLLMM